MSVMPAARMVSRQRTMTGCSPPAESGSGRRSLHHPIRLEWPAAGTRAVTFGVMAIPPLDQLRNNAYCDLPRGIAANGEADRDGEAGEGLLSVPFVAQGGKEGFLLAPAADDADEAGRRGEGGPGSGKIALKSGGGDDDAGGGVDWESAY